MAHELENNPTEEGVGTPDPGGSPIPVDAHESWWRRLANIFWGYDFFVSYKWASGGTYAVSLAERLRDRGYDCFLDQSEFAAGDDWKRQAQKVLRNTRRLVVVATRKAVIESEAVRHEIEVFARRSERIIPIVFGARFLEDEQKRFPTLKLIPDTTIDIVEDESRLDKGPSDTILTQLIQAHRLIRRRSLRALVVAAALAVLAMAAVGASIFWGLAVLARNDAEAARVEEERQKRLARTAELVNKADLLRETEGPNLEESLQHAVDAYENSRLAGAPSSEARRAIEQALALRPERIGAPWMPFGKPTRMHLRTIGPQLVFLRKDRGPAGEPFALVAELDGDTQHWRVLQKFTSDEHGGPIADQFGRLIEAPGHPRWLLTQKGGKVSVWDITKGEKSAQLAFKHAPGDPDGLELLAINAAAEHAVVRSGSKLTVWSLDQSSQQSTVLPVEYRPALYAISPSAERVAWARQNEFVVVTTMDGKEVLKYPITGGGGHAKSLQFIEGTRFQSDFAVFVSWSANQIMAQPPGARRGLPSHQAGIWYLGSNTRRAERDASDGNPPDMIHVRENPFEIVFRRGVSDPSLAILDPNNPVQWLDLESQISFTLGTAAGPGRKARFGDNEILIVHTDRTARLWNVKARRESLRFTAKDGTIEDAGFFTVRSGNKTPTSAVVTLDTNGNVQGWTARRGVASVETLINGE